METTAEQNSATILSLWQCIFAVSINKDAKKGEPLKEKNALAMKQIYSHMKELRLANHGGIDMPDLSSIAEMTKPFNDIFSGMPKEKWTEEFCSFMREAGCMRVELEGLNERLNSIDLSNPSTLLNNNEPKDIITLLTLWYWLATWSSYDQPKDHSAKDEFIKAIESQSKDLGFLMVQTTPIDPIEEKKLQILLSKLLQMLKLDYQLWMDSLKRFIDTLTLHPSMTSPTPSMPLMPYDNPYNSTKYLSGAKFRVAKSIGKGASKAIVVELLVEGGKAVFANKDEIVGKLKSLGHNVADFTEKEVDSFVNEIEGLMDATKKGMEKVGVEIEEAVNNAFKNSKDWVGQAVNDTEKWVDQAADDTTEWIGQAAKDTGNFFKGLGRLF